MLNLVNPRAIRALGGLQLILLGALISCGGGGPSQPVAAPPTASKAGALVALALDLTLRAGTAGRVSLDDVMRALLTRYYRQGKGFSTADLLGELRVYNQ